MAPLSAAPPRCQRVAAAELPCCRSENVSHSGDSSDLTPPQTHCLMPLQLHDSANWRLPKSGFFGCRRGTACCSKICLQGKSETCTPAPGRCSLIIQSGDRTQAKQSRREREEKRWTGQTTAQSLTLKMVVSSSCGSSAARSARARSARSVVGIVAPLVTRPRSRSPTACRSATLTTSCGFEGFSFQGS